MKITVDIGKGYALRSATGGLVTNAKTGKPLETLAPNKQIHMTAQESEWEVPDDCAVTKVGFKYAPIAFGGGGTTSGEVSLPLGYTRVEYLKSTGTQYIETWLTINNGSAFTVDCGIDPNSGVANGAVFGYQNTGITQDRAGWSEFTDGKRGWLFWGTVSENTDLPTTSTERHRVQLSQSGLFYNGAKLRSLSSVSAFQTSGTCWLFARNCPGITVEKYHGNIYSFTFEQDGEQKLNFVPCVTPLGEPAMWDYVNGAAYTNSGDGAFVVGLDMLSLAMITQSLPEAQPGASAELSVVLKGDESSLVWQAITEAVALKGWTVRVVDWESASAATTYGLRRTRQMVWCKAAKGEYGAYVDPNGERFSIDSVMAIAGPLGTDPTEYGYEPFDSVEQAAEEWGLVPYEYPEDELSNVE